LKLYKKNKNVRFQFDFNITLELKAVICNVLCAKTYKQLKESVSKIISKVKIVKKLFFFLKIKNIATVLAGAFKLW